MPVLAHETGLVRQADEHAHIVEQIHHGQGENNGKQAVVQRALEVHLQEGLRGQGQFAGKNRPAGHGRNPQQHARQGDGQNADDHGAGNAQGHQRADQKDPGHGQQGLGLAQIAQGHESGGVRRHNAAAFHADKGDERADAHHNGVFQVHGHGIDDHLAHAGRRETPGRK